MNKEQLQKRITEIEAAMAQLVSQHAKLSGHLDEAKLMLSEMDKLGETCGETNAEPVAEVAHQEHE